MPEEHSFIIVTHDLDNGWASPVLEVTTTLPTGEAMQAIRKRITCWMLSTAGRAFTRKHLAEDEYMDTNWFHVADHPEILDGLPGITVRPLLTDVEAVDEAEDLNPWRNLTDEPEGPYTLRRSRIAETLGIPPESKDRRIKRRHNDIRRRDAAANKMLALHPSLLASLPAEVLRTLGYLPAI